MALKKCQVSTSNLCCETSQELVVSELWRPQEGCRFFSLLASYHQYLIDLLCKEKEKEGY